MTCIGCGKQLGDGTIWGRIRLPESGTERAICLGCYTDPEIDLTAALAGTATGEVGR